VPATSPRIAPVVDLVVWEDPPDVRRGKKVSFDAAVLRSLKANPGRWARIDDLKSKSAAASRTTAFNKGRYAPVAPPLWEAAGRRTPTGSALYLRYVGPEG